MNFRALDSRDERKGFRSTNAVDVLVWDTYFDRQSMKLDSALLESDFNAVWGSSVNVSNQKDSDQIPPEASNDDNESTNTSPRKVRRGQAAFKRRLMRLYDGRCAISGVGVEQVLVAAHIVDHALTGNNHSSNGLILRSDLHSLFDSGLLTINPDSLVVSVCKTLNESEYYRDFHGKKLRNRIDKSKPSAELLRTKNRTSG